MREIYWVHPSYAYLHFQLLQGVQSLRLVQDGVIALRHVPNLPTFLCKQKLGQIKAPCHCRCCFIKLWRVKLRDFYSGTVWQRPRVHGHRHSANLASRIQNLMFSITCRIPSTRLHFFNSILSPCLPAILAGRVL